MNWFGSIADIAEAAGRKSSKLEYFSTYLVAYGAFGLVALTFLDSAFIPLPGANDAMMFLLTLKRPAWMFIYALAATLGSTLGCLVLYFISRRIGKGALTRFSEEKQRRVKDAIDRYDVLSVLVASVLPPPFPLKLFVVTSGVVRLNAVRFALAIAAGRLFRFLLIGFLTLRYGEQAIQLLKQYATTIGVAVAVLIILVFVGRNFLLRKQRSVETASEQG